MAPPGTRAGGDRDEAGPLPAAYRALLGELWRLNRVHNGPEMAEAAERLAAFCRARLHGEARVHWYAPGTVWNWWVVPPRWSVRDFQLTGPDGRVIATAADHPLTVCPYSAAVDAEMDRDELLRHVVSRPDLPDAYSFAFRQMYRHWEADWAIALPHAVVRGLPPGRYRVRIDARRDDAPMPVFEYHLPGRSSRTVYIAAHLDHPGQVNDSLSGCVAALQIVEDLERVFGTPEYSYRVWLVPEIIGSAVHLKANEESLLPDAWACFCPNMTAHPAPLAICLSKRQESFLDAALVLAAAEAGYEHRVGAFHKYPDCGDEISFDAVGYDIPATTLSRVGEMFAHYHSSKDDLPTFLRPDWVARHGEFVAVAAAAFRHLERDRALHPRFRGNPCLSNPSLGLYLDPTNVNNLAAGRATADLDGNAIDPRNFMEFFLDALSRDGTTVLEIAAAARLPFDFVLAYAEAFAAKGLVELRPVERRAWRREVAGTSLTLAGIVGR